MQENKINVLLRPSKSPDLNPIENLWRTLKRNILARKSRNIKEIELVAIDEWSKIPQNTCSNLVINYNKLLNELVKSKGFAMDY